MPPNFNQPQPQQLSPGQGVMAPPQQPQQPQQPQAAPPPPPDPGADFGDLDPDQLQRLADAYGISYHEAATMLRMKRAEALASTPQAHGRQVGDVFVASNPLEVAGTGMQRALGLKRMRDTSDEMDQLGDRYAKDAGAGYQLMGGNLRF
jgi:hypothetical protein